MDMQVVQQAIQWIQENVGDMTSKQELLQKAQGSALPGEVKSTLQSLPDGQISKDSVISMIKDKVVAGVGGKMGGGMGGMFGG